MDKDPAKAEAFFRYTKACRIAEFNRTFKAGDRTVFVEVQERKARQLVERYPDFPDAFRKRFPERAHLAIDT